MTNRSLEGTQSKKITNVEKANARHVLRGLAIIVPQAMHTHVARRARSEAAREADFDEHRADVRGFGCDGGDGRDYAFCA